MNLNAFFIDGNILARRISPAAGIVIADISLAFFHGLVGVTAKNKISAILGSVPERGAGHLVREPEPTLALPFQVMAEFHIMKIYSLDKIVDAGSEIREKGIINQEPIKLVAMNREVGLPAIVPNISFVDFGADERTENISQAHVVIPDYPSDFLFLGNLSDIIQEFPAFGIEMAEIKAIKNIPEEHELLERIALEHGERLPGLAHR